MDLTILKHAMSLTVREQLIRSLQEGEPRDFGLFLSEVEDSINFVFEWYKGTISPLAEVNREFAALHDDTHAPTRAVNALLEHDELYDFWYNSEDAFDSVD